MLITGVRERVPGKLPQCRAADDPRGHRGLQVKQQPAGDEVGVCAAERSGQRERRAEHRGGVEQVGVIGRDRRGRQRDVVNIAGVDKSSGVALDARLGARRGLASSGAELRPFG